MCFVSKLAAKLWKPHEFHSSQICSCFAKLFARMFIYKSPVRSVLSLCQPLHLFSRLIYFFTHCQFPLLNVLLQTWTHFDRPPQPAKRIGDVYARIVLCLFNLSATRTYAIRIPIAKLFSTACLSMAGHTQNETNRTEWHQKPKWTIEYNNNKWRCPTVINAKRWNILFHLSNMTLYKRHIHTPPSPLSAVPRPMFKVHARNSIRFNYSNPKMCDQQHEMENETKSTSHILVDRNISDRFDDGVTVYLHRRKWMRLWPSRWPLLHSQLQPFNIILNVIVDSSSCTLHACTKTINSIILIVYHPCAPWPGASMRASV